MIALSFALASITALGQGNSEWFEPTRIDAETPLLSPARTHHSGKFGGVQIDFDVVAEEFLLKDKDDKPAATMFTTAYLRTDWDEAEPRPVLFLFNGGPGASSSPLHLGIGPVRRPAGDPNGELVPNPASPLDGVDLVFVDPVGTGYTRLFREDAGAAFWGMEQDADTALWLVESWLERHGRREDPVYLMGESYGGTRVVLMASRAESIGFQGLLLLSPALDYSGGTQTVGNNRPYVARVPTMAATAAYHGVTERSGRNIGDVFEQAATWAVSEYAAALYQGNTLEAPRKTAVARRLAELTGLEADYIEQVNLRVDRSEFSDRLLPGLRVGSLDARITGPVAEYQDKRPPGNDPSMAPRGEGRGSGDLLDAYFSEKLGLDAGHPYRTLNLHLNGQWDWGQSSAFRPRLSVAQQLEDAMKANPELDVWIGGGIYDLVTPVMAARYVASQVDVDPGRFTLTAFEGGHSTFEHEASRRAIGDAIRLFVQPPITGIQDPR